MQLEQLHDYQKLAIRRMINEPELGLFLDLGLGKTVISLVAIKRLILTGKAKRILIIAPITVMHNVWMQEAKKWEYTRDLSFTVLHGPEKAGRILHPANVHLVNYEGIQWLCDIIRRRFRTFPYDMVIFDESSKLKDSTTKRFKTLKGLVKFFRRRYLLTATPAPNALSELWAQFFIMDGGATLGTSFYGFHNRHFYEAYRYKWTLKEGSEAEIRETVSPKTMRLAAEDYLKMPPITYNKIKVSLTPKLMDMYRELEREYFLELEDESEVEVFNAVALSSKLRQFIQGGVYTQEFEVYEARNKWKVLHKIKLDVLKELVDTAAGQPILCAIQFRGELSMIQKAFKHDVPVIAGGTSSSLAQRYITEWNEGTIPLLLCHPASLSHGVNLQSGGHTMLWFGLTWSLEQYLQLNGRLYRQGQINPVTIHHIVMQNTVDEVVMKALQQKEKTQRGLLSFIKEYWRRKEGK